MEGIAQRAVWQRPDALAAYSVGVDHKAIARWRASRLPAIRRAHWEPLIQILEQLPFGSEIRELHPEFSWGVRDGCIRIGESGQLTAAQDELLAQAIRLLMPWRKGPLELFGRYVDTEWRSDWKWSRIAPALAPLEGKLVADVGCGNGYYLLRAAEQNPELLLGLDPSEQFYHSFEFFQRFLQLPSLQYELLGAEHLPAFENFFDVVLCCGVLYHQRNPLDALRLIWNSVKPGGQVLIETQAVPGEGTTALFVEDRYAKARNVFFIPTADCLVAWMRKSGFTNVELVSSVQLTTDEQRRTEFAQYESLSDFLNPEDQSRTVEGHPAPLRVAAVGVRPQR